MWYGLYAKDARAPSISANQEEEVWQSTYRTASGSHGGLRTGPEGTAEAERRRRARREQTEEEKEGQRQGETSRSDGNKQKERRGEAALPGQAHAGPGGLREDAGEAANGADPEEGIQDPQAESGGLQQAPGHTHRALRYPQSQLDQVVSWPWLWSSIEGEQEAASGLSWVALVFSGNILSHTPMPLLLR